MRMKIAAIFAIFAVSGIWAAELNLRMPFKPGRISAIAWWEAEKSKLVEENAKKLLSITAGSGIRFKNHFQGQAGDCLEFELTLKCEKGPVSVRLSQHSKEGYIGEVATMASPVKDEPVVYRGEILLEDATEPDKDGIIRRVSEFSISIYAHQGSENVLLENIKATLKVKERL